MIIEGMVCRLEFSPYRRGDLKELVEKSGENLEVDKG